eukprot:9122582-Ditylum_brightwellii.AAC.1
MEQLGTMEEDLKDMCKLNATITANIEFVDDSVFTDISGIDANDKKLVKIGDYCYSAKKWRDGQ